MKKWTPSPGGAALAALGLVLSLDFLFTAWTWIGWNSRPALGQDPFLLYALRLREDGILPLGNDHPLYPGLLALWTTRDPSSFTWSKLFSLATGVLTLAATWRCGARLFGAAAGALAAAWLSANWIHLSLSTSLRAEVVLPPLFLLSWYAGWRGFREKPQWWAWSGLFAGLAYLAKGTGPLLAFAWAFAWALDGLRSPKRLPRGLWFVLGFAPPAALLWWANHGVLGAAGSNFSMQHAVWLESWWDLQGADLRTLTFSNYWAAHGVSGIVSRELTGIVRFVPVWLSCLVPSDTFPVLRLLAWPALAAAAWASWRARSDAWTALRRFDGAAWFTAALALVFFLLFAWYHQVSPSERFVGVLNPIVLLLLSAAAASAWRTLPASVARRGPLAAGSLAALVALSLGLKAKGWGVARPFAADRPLPCYEETFAWADAAPERVLYGPSADLPLWNLRRPERLIALPERPALELPAWLDARRIDRAVIDWDMASRPIFRGWVEPDGERGVRLVRPPKGWELDGIDGLHVPPHQLRLKRQSRKASSAARGR